MKKRFGNVKDLPFHFGVLDKERLEQIKRENPGQPKNMDYRTEFIKGRGASKKDPTWNRQKHIHTCCQSKVPWRHKAQCRKILKDTDDFSDIGEWNPNNL